MQPEISYLLITCGISSSDKKKERRKKEHKAQIIHPLYFKNNILVNICCNYLLTD